MLYTLVTLGNFTILLDEHRTAITCVKQRFFYQKQHFPHLLNYKLVWPSSNHSGDEISGSRTGVEVLRICFTDESISWISLV